MPRRLMMPRQPRVAGSSTGALTRNEVSFRLRRVDGSADAASLAGVPSLGAAAAANVVVSTGTVAGVCSGSAIAAAETTGRRCYAIELDPKYVDVIVARWERLSGKKADREAA